MTATITAVAPPSLVYRGRDWLALAPAVAVLGVLVLLSVKKLVEVHEREEPPMAVSLLEETPLPELPEPPKAVPRERPAQVPREWTPPVDKAPPPDLRAIEPALPAEPVRMPVSEKRTEAPPVETTAPPQTELPPHPAPQAEAGYVAQLRSYLESVKRYPTSREARLQRPVGRVRLWLDVARDGTLRDAGIERSSDSMILDAAALSTVRQGRYPPFPPESFAGKSGNRFTVNLDYSLEPAR